MFDLPVLFANAGLLIIFFAIVDKCSELLTQFGLIVFYLNDVITTARFDEAERLLKIASKNTTGHKSQIMALTTIFEKLANLKETTNP